MSALSRNLKTSFLCFILRKIQHVETNGVVREHNFGHARNLWKTQQIGIMHKFVRCLVRA